MKVGIIRCQQTEVYCLVTTGLFSPKKEKGGFKQTGPAEVIGINSCGGCIGTNKF